MSTWNSLRLTVPDSLSDPLSGLFMDLGAEGIWQDGLDLVAYFPSSMRADEIELALNAWLAHLSACGVAVFTPECVWQREDEGDWITAWQDHFKPIEVGKRLIVLPEWEPLAKAGERLPIRIKPGRGFGTGGHGTTATCLERIEHYLKAQADPSAVRVMDVGTGSGILAIGAKCLGAGHVEGFDNDPDAVENAEQNAALNDTDIHMFTATIDQVNSTYDLVLANLLAHVIVELMADLKRIMAPGARLILSGILNEQVDRIDAALKATGMKAVNYTSNGMWMTVDAEVG
jgi:ribosomal protein L11 methyltransferase